MSRDLAQSKSPSNYLDWALIMRTIVAINRALSYVAQRQFVPKYDVLLLQIALYSAPVLLFVFKIELGTVKLAPVFQRVCVFVCLC